MTLVVMHLLPASAQQLWQGQLKLKRKVIEIVHDAANGKQKVILTTPDESFAPAAADSVHISADSMWVSFRKGDFIYKGAFEKGHTLLRGLLTISAKSVPFQFHRVDSLQDVEIMQAPKPPFPYSKQEVTYSGGDPSVKLSGTLYLPNGVKKPPVAVFLPGTGKQDRTSKMGAHPYYDVIMDQLCRKGIAVLWADDRGVGKSTGNFDDATTADFAKDAIAGVEYLKTLKTVDTKHIGVIGHSEGGTMACIAAASCKDVAFMVSLAGVAVDGLTGLILQNEGMVSQSPITVEEIAAYDTINSRLFRTIHDHGYEKKVDTLLLETFAKWKQEQSEALIKKMRFDDYIGDRYIQRFIPLTKSKWYMYMITYDPAETIRKITVPVLALNGDKDIMVDADANLQAYEAGLKTNKDHTILKLPGLNHMFQHCQECTPQEYTRLEETISPDVLNLVAGWIRKHSK